MNDYRQIKNRLTKEERDGMSRMIEAIRLKRVEATTKPTPESEEVSKNLEGVKPEGVHWGLAYSK